MKRYLLLPAMMLLVAAVAFAQTDAGGDDTENTGPETTVQFFVVICEDSAVVNLNGFATPGFDIFYQVFNGSSGGGESLTSLRRANVDGDYAFSERISYRDGQRIAPGAIGSVRVIIAQTDTPENPSFETVADDVQDGCNDAQNPLQSSDNAGDPVTAEPVSSAPDGIANPNGGVLNPETEITPEPEVVLGPRTGPVDPRRNRDPGLLFALCDAFYPESEPGLLFDTDNIRIFWYWVADTEERLAQNLAASTFEVNLNDVPLFPVSVSPITERDGLFYVFYTANLGNLSPGFYEVAYRQTFNQRITDGFNQFGPGTGLVEIKTNCNFKVELNEDNIRNVAYNQQYTGREGPTHDFERAIVQQRVLRDYLESRSNVGQRDGEN
jgi:hypothetical protein